MMLSNELRYSLSELRVTLKNICPPPIAAFLILTAILLIRRENPAKCPSLVVQDDPGRCIRNQGSCRRKQTRGRRNQGTEGETRNRL